ncbi:MAG TPA: hypothetical protein VG205_03265, partial [Acidimicrobiales bacterium]|nr:hypothetical protein [Acidimicrobiales bacterium]
MASTMTKMAPRRARVRVRPSVSSCMVQKLPVTIAHRDLLVVEQCSLAASVLIRKLPKNYNLAREFPAG